MNTIRYTMPGFVLSVLVALLARWLESKLPVHFIGASIMALFIGMTINHVFKLGKKFKPGLKFTSKKILKLAIVLLGASLSMGTILHVGRLSLTVMFFTLFTCFGAGYFIGKWLGLDWKLSNMISAGTGICGGSAIAAMAPVIEAKDKDVAYAMSATFLFDMAMVLLFPIMGNMMGLSDMAYGLWAGTAVNDTSSVVAAGYAFSEAAGDFATMVKLTRTLTIIPVVLIFSLINAYMNSKKSIGNESQKKVKITSLFPWFILAFMGMALINSLGFFPAVFAAGSKSISKFLMVTALAAIGLNTDIHEMKKSGISPLIHGFLISALVVVVAITVEYYMGLV
ncbi:YeiH family putative sulfate export transporter [Alkalibacter rhizosphaerae]|uniref:YeiH family putative sulfate export transporter n=1 Tax=Alkalibacter rhizosphaerae TaxID=2815577 RepID=A0A975AIA1_9FIRM|nr:YeiH family protein [Alkalibacter rhizosphaerae]QSX08469.1 YeiH family putative sulfate export transporter [Alkalibacter rhizosphaerae]